MFYQFLKILVGFTLKIFFKKIFITGTEKVNNDRPQLIASNHPNGFLEPLLMACFFPKDLHFLVRGDVFDNKFLRPILTSTHQIPIFRFRDGFSKLRENSQTMDESMRVLLDHKNLLIFAEGGTESIKKLRPLQKGFARIVFQTLDKKPDLPLEILPVGINFTYPSKFNKEVMLRVSTPINVSPFYKIYLEDKNKGIDALLNELYNRIKENVIHLEDQHRLSLFEKMVEVERCKLPLNHIPIYLQNNTRLDIEKSLAEKIDHLPADSLDALHSEIKILESEMKSHGFTWSDITKIPLNIRTTFILVIGLIPALIGFIIHLLPLGVGYYFTKSKVKQKEFKASILMVSTLVLMLLQYITWILLAIMKVVNWQMLLLGIACGLWLKYYYMVAETTNFKNIIKHKNFREKALLLLEKI